MLLTFTGNLDLARHQAASRGNARMNQDHSQTRQGGRYVNKAIIQCDGISRGIQGRGGVRGLGEWCPACRGKWAHFPEWSPWPPSQQQPTVHFLPAHSSWLVAHCLPQPPHFSCLLNSSSNCEGSKDSTRSSFFVPCNCLPAVAFIPMV